MYRRVPDAVQRLLRCSAEPGPIALNNGGPRISSATLTHCAASGANKAYCRKIPNRPPDCGGCGGGCCWTCACGGGSGRGACCTCCFGAGGRFCAGGGAGFGASVCTLTTVASGALQSVSQMS